MLYRVTLVIDVEIDSPYITDVEDEIVPAIKQLQHDNTNIGLAVQYRAEMITRDDRGRLSLVPEQWSEMLI